MSWLDATIRSLATVVYFVVASVWLPSRILRTDTVAAADAGVRDLVAVVVWGLAVAIGIGGLRVAQRRGWL